MKRTENERDRFNVQMEMERKKMNLDTMLAENPALAKMDVNELFAQQQVVDLFVNDQFEVSDPELRRKGMDKLMVQLTGQQEVNRINADREKAMDDNATAMLFALDHKQPPSQAVDAAYNRGTKKQEYGFNDAVDVTAKLADGMINYSQTHLDIKGIDHMLDKIEGGGYEADNDTVLKLRKARAHIMKDTMVRTAKAADKDSLASMWQRSAAGSNNKAREAYYGSDQETQDVTMFVQNYLNETGVTLEDHVATAVVRANLGFKNNNKPDPTVRDVLATGFFSLQDAEPIEDMEQAPKRFSDMMQVIDALGDKSSAYFNEKEWAALRAYRHIVENGKDEVSATRKLQQIVNNDIDVRLDYRTDGDVSGWIDKEFTVVPGIKDQLKDSVAMYYKTGVPLEAAKELAQKDFEATHTELNNTWIRTSLLPDGIRDKLPQINTMLVNNFWHENKQDLEDSGYSKDDIIVTVNEDGLVIADKTTLEPVSTYSYGNYSYSDSVYEWQDMTNGVIGDDQAVETSLWFNKLSQRARTVETAQLSERLGTYNEKTGRWEGDAFKAIQNGADQVSHVREYTYSEAQKIKRQLDAAEKAGNDQKSMDKQEEGGIFGYFLK
ncbi:hypothetical protein [Vibrio panuliri]|nr:hypothetical protein [Vibrio panuliri]KAB1460893.1 hypothetical protein F7O85_00520 [Vibrio panuliri]